MSHKSFLYELDDYEAIVLIHRMILVTEKALEYKGEMKWLSSDLIGLYQVYFFDFDGVIINSDKIRVKAFEYALKNFNDKLISDFLNYHKENGGLSRYNKFERFRNLTGSSDEDVMNWLKLYNDYCKEKLIESSLLIKETLSMIKNLNKHSYKLYIVSASDQEELRFIVKSQNIDKYFNGILGSPTTKKKCFKFNSA